MPNKQDIFDDIEQYQASELIQFIKDGLFTFDELVAETVGLLPANVRKEIQRSLSSSEDDDWQNALTQNTEEAYMQFLRSHPDSQYRDEARNHIAKLAELASKAEQISAWDNIDKSSISDLKRFIEKYPDDEHVKEAKKLINQLEREEFLGFDSEAIIDSINNIKTNKLILDPDSKILETITGYINQKKISVKELLNIIAADHNLLSSSIIKRLIDDGCITYKDLEAIGINRKFIQAMANGEKPQPLQGYKAPLEKINKVCTEVYFWGIPSSGKSCALGAILSVANNGNVALSMKKNNKCQGYNYMIRLAHLFQANGKVGTMPESTAISSTYEMGFDLEDQKHKVHPITCIDLAGELLRSMYKSDANLSMTGQEIEALDTLTSILIDNRTKNRKMHFFVIEYGGEQREYEGLDQTEYLDAAVRYIEHTGIFKKDTDAIYILYTKVDKAGVKGQELIDVLTQYTDKYYKGFFNGLKKIARDCEINGGEVLRIPFTLGEVCFQNYCLFNSKSAENIVKILLTRTKGENTGWLSKITNGLSR